MGNTPRLVRWLAMSSLALCVAVNAAGSARAVPSPSSTTLVTPILSARRVPSLVFAAARREALDSALNAVVTASPPNTCLQVALNGQTLYTHRATDVLAPASNQKLLTAQLALDLLGTNFHYETTVRGNLSAGGVVQGNLYLIGGGDPVLSTNAYRAHFGTPAPAATSLETLADSVVSAGVHEITGGVMGDETRYDNLRKVPWWPDRYLDQHQLGPLSALEVNQSFTEFPQTYSEDSLGELTAAQNPPTFAATTFATLLRARGVKVDGAPGATPVGSDEHLIASISSPPLSAIAAQMLSRSDNQIAELLVKEIGKAKTGTGSTEAGLAQMRTALKQLGIASSGTVLRDGSGLDRDNRVSCAAIVSLLNRVPAQSVLKRGLAVGGETGTLAKRFTDPSVKGRIRAKTGTLDDVTALSGFADARYGPTFVFSYIANDQYVSPSLLGAQEVLAKALVNGGGDLRLSSLGPQ